MSLNTTPRTWVAGEVVTAAEMNTEVRDALTGIQTAWTAYTPTTAGVTLGTGGTITGAYMQVGKTIHYRVTMTLGTGGLLTGTGFIGLPVTAVTRTSRTPMGAAVCFDSSANAYFMRHAGWDTASRVHFIDDAGALVAAAAPFTWAISDKLEVSGTYEAA